MPLGPIATVIGVFPVDENQVEANIGDDSFDLSASFERDIRGFYTLEYLLFGTGESDAELISHFNDDRKAYLLLINEEIVKITSEVLAEWQNTYRQQFVESTGTSAGSSISLLYNAFVKDYENLKNFKVELPAGLTAGQSGADPTLVEAYYSGISKSLIEAHFQNSLHIWEGTSREGQDLVGFKEYLNEVVGGPELISKTQLSTQEISEAILSLPSGSLSEIIETPEVEQLRNLLQSNTANFKSSMSSLLGISITFNSGDGD